MNQFNKDIIAALSSDKNITLNEVLRRQIEVAANQFLQNELTAVLGYEPRTRIDRSKDDVNYRNGAYTRTIDTEYGEINLTIPRDRLNKFQNALFPPYVRRTDDWRKWSSRCTPRASQLVKSLIWLRECMATTTHQPRFQTSLSGRNTWLKSSTSANSSTHSTSVCSSMLLTFRYAVVPLNEKPLT